ncbi:ORF1 [Torque teno ocelot virus]|uniref:Capsid protein n=1 Tax=Torque teno ocelot virus TaxID=2579707 RepID=A0A4P8W9Q8_9VIRU|nr:ORF1 [Torque teno ocelot virus]QCS38452.1 ORF1 [Torque teno ocelot virus]
MLRRHRRRFRGRRYRRGRYHPRAWGHRRRRYFGRWRPRVRKYSVREWIPGRHEYIYVRGWEPLGNLCNTDYNTTEATPYKSVEPQGGTGQWHGTWGAHYFTANNLQLRAQTYWNQWSRDWATYDYIQYLGGTILIPQTGRCTWMFNTDEYLQTKIGEYNPSVVEQRWVHPGILLNNPKTHIIYPVNLMKRRKYYKIRCYPPPGWKGLQRLPDAGNYIILHWAWTFCDLSAGFYNSSYDSSEAHACTQEPWWGKNLNLNKWMDRSKYKQCTSSIAPEDTWGPFLPCRYNSYETSLFFMYKFKFKVVGNALWRAVPRNISSKGLVPTPGPDGDEIMPRTARAGIERPQDEGDIWPGDLDSDGILTEKALIRITGDHRRHKPRKLGRSRRLKLIAEKLRLILADKQLLRK